VRETHTTGARASRTAYGTKRTSSGLAKVLGSQEEFDYPALNNSDSGKEVFSGSRPSTMASSHASVFFDENDFDDDLELDLEDLADKQTVQYPKLPPVKSTVSQRDSGYGSVDREVNPKSEPDSSQPVPWSSSPVEHFHPPPAPRVQPTKRRTLPWLQNGQGKEMSKSAAEPVFEPEDADEGERPKKRKATQQSAGDFTPLPKDSSSKAYAWNTTASAVKEQQRALREARKELTKTNAATEEDILEAKSRTKQNKVHRIFLSEEQQHVLSLVTEHKKSVFFTGSAGQTPYHWVARSD
jgi:ATP-dependent DNA helicase PIF1